MTEAHGRFERELSEREAKVAESSDKLREHEKYLTDFEIKSINRQEELNGKISELEQRESDLKLVKEKEEDIITKRLEDFEIQKDQLKAECKNLDRKNSLIDTKLEAIEKDLAQISERESVLTKQELSIRTKEEWLSQQILALSVRDSNPLIMHKENSQKHTISPCIELQQTRQTPQELNADIKEVSQNLRMMSTELEGCQERKDIPKDMQKGVSLNEQNMCHRHQSANTKRKIAARIDTWESPQHLMDARSEGLDIESKFFGGENRREEIETRAKMEEGFPNRTVQVCQFITVAFVQFSLLFVIL